MQKKKWFKFPAKQKIQVASNSAGSDAIKNLKRSQGLERRSGHTKITSSSNTQCFNRVQFSNLGFSTERFVFETLEPEKKSTWFGLCANRNISKPENLRMAELAIPRTTVNLILSKIFFFLIFFRLKMKERSKFLKDFNCNFFVVVINYCLQADC